MSIELRGIGHRFAGGRGVSDISFNVEHGEVVCLLGPNGSGKSTTLRILLGLIRGVGDVLVDGLPARRPRLSANLGGVIDDGGLDGSWTVRQYLRLIATARGASWSAVGTALDLNALGELADRRIRTLSLGQAQRVAFAGATLGNPANLVLDEPLNGVDAHAVPLLLQRIRGLADSGASVLITSHHLSHLERLVDRVVVLQSGQIIANSPIDEFLAASARSHVLVECDESEELAEELRRMGVYETDARSPQELLVRGADRRAVGEAAFRRRLLVTRIEDVTPTLEEVYLSMTESSASPQHQGDATVNGTGR